MKFNSKRIKWILGVPSSCHHSRSRNVLPFLTPPDKGSYPSRGPSNCSYPSREHRNHVIPLSGSLLKWSWKCKHQLSIVNIPPTFPSFTLFPTLTCFHNVWYINVSDIVLMSCYCSCCVISLVLYVVVFHPNFVHLVGLQGIAKY